MNKFFDFIRDNIVVVLLSVFFYGMFMYYSLGGGGLCDCEKTESYRPSHSNRISVNRFYHK